MGDITELKPCPLCGSTESLTVYMEYLPTNKKEAGVVECTYDGCPMIIRAKNIEEAVERWNRRPREDFLVEQNQLLTKQLIAGIALENDLRIKLIEAITALGYYADPEFLEREKDWIGHVAVETLAKIKEDKNA